MKLIMFYYCTTDFTMIRIMAIHIDSNLFSRDKFAKFLMQVYFDFSKTVISFLIF